jgi:hypothetical protein
VIGCFCIASIECQQGLERIGRLPKLPCANKVWKDLGVFPSRRVVGRLSGRDEAVAVVPIGHGAAALLAHPTPFVVFVLQVLNANKVWKELGVFPSCRVVGRLSHCDDAVAVVPIGHGTAALLAQPTQLVLFCISSIECRQGLERDGK